MPSYVKINEVTALLKQHNLLVSISTIDSGQKFSGIAIDSRKAKKGDIFICLSGYVTDGHLYADSAVLNGATLIVAERPVNAEGDIILVKNSRLAAAYLSRLFYHIDDDKMKLVGVTGTNGKSTTAYLGYQLARLAGKNAGFIGTIGYFINDKHYPTSLTTPDIIDQCKILSQMQQSEIEIVFMEVSSHALALHRLAGLKFSAAMFLNLSQDHLDFHDNMDEYFKCKSQLFSQLKPEGISLINTDDNFGKKLWNTISGNKYSLSYYDGDISYIINKLTAGMSEYTLTINDIDYHVKSGLNGDFNIQNLSFALASIMLLYPKIQKEEIIKNTMNLKAVPGRLEKVKNPENKIIIIDYAHTPEAIEKSAAPWQNLKRVD
ncbi:MAG: UDP-N-acetylmuramoyl-L-alanyl-D-glutamate--2,6-diaminopimelate ligase [Candidatus Stygibacter australis]|nr:UDP-N-acetylmuramoyl-L-alanyl-D-glutamate--2,6-diaminopimelate ligase [Candidatus Stygibacter australis]